MTYNDRPALLEHPRDKLEADCDRPTRRVARPHVWPQPFSVSAMGMY
jgi:hypothetical protein